MAKLGFLGLGIMGYPMARNLIQAGHDVGLWSNTADKARQLAQSAGGRFCATPAEAAAGAECVFLCVGDSAMSENLILGEKGIAQGAKAGAVVVDASTVSPSSSRAIGSKLAKSGFHFLDAPCTGSKPGAEGGTLTFMIGGDKEVFERVRPVLRADGQAPVLLRRTGHGSARQAHAESYSFQHLTSVQRRHGARHESRSRPGTDAGDPRQQCRQVRTHLVQGAFRSSARLLDQLQREVDAQGHRAHAGLGQRARRASSINGIDPADVPGRHRARATEKRIFALLSRS